jgi:cytochrome c-type biogenesis protein CcmE
MTPRHKRFMLAGIVLGGAAVGVTLVLNAFNSNLVFFYSPTDVQQQQGAEGPHLPPGRPGRGRQRQAPA